MSRLLRCGAQIGLAHGDALAVGADDQNLTARGDLARGLGALRLVESLEVLCRAVGQLFTLPFLNRRAGLRTERRHDFIISLTGDQFCDPSPHRVRVAFGRQIEFRIERMQTRHPASAIALAPQAESAEEGLELARVKLMMGVSHPLRIDHRWLEGARPIRRDSA